MNIPLDIWIEVSYHLSPYRLSLTTTMHHIYDESWFKRKLLWFNPDATLYISWRITYKRSFYQEAFRLLSINYGLSKELQYQNKFIY